MADLFREIDEDLRRDRMLRLWQQYGYLLGVGVGLIIIGTGLFVGWQSWQTRLRDADAARFTAAIALAQNGPSEGAIKDLQVLAASGHAGYQLISRIEAAALQAQGKNAAGGLAALWAIADDATVDNSYRGLASVLWGLYGVDSLPREVVDGTLLQLTAPDNPWRYLATEVMALADLRAGDKPRAIKGYQSLADDLGAPQSQRARAAEIITDLQN